MTRPKKYQDEDFFDAEGNLTATSWQLREEEEERKRAEQEKKHMEELSRAETNRRFAIDERRAEFEETIAEEQRRRKIREAWMNLPKWVRDMPRTPMTDPPTEGKKEKLLYSMTGKVTLTDNERKQRETDLKKMKMAIADHETINRPFPHRTPMIPVAVVPLGHELGSTMLSRAVSQALAENRESGSSVVIDFGGEGNKLSEWYEYSDRQNMVLKYILSYIRSNQTSLMSMAETFRVGGDRQYYIANHPSPERRIDPGIPEVADIYRYIKNTYGGIALFDCDFDDKDSMIGTVAIAKTRIFLLPISMDAPKILMDTLNDIKEVVGEDRMQGIIDSSVLIVSGVSAATQTPQGKSALKKLIEDCSAASGISLKRSYIIPHDKELMKPPLRWGNLKFSTAHAFRWIAGRIVSDVVGDYDGVSAMDKARK